MKIESEVLPDLKTERTDVVPALAPYLRVVPLAFYLAVLGSLALSGYFLFELRAAAVELETVRAAAAQSQKELAEAETDRTALQAEAKRGSDFVAWIEGSKNVQPLVTAVTRSMDEQSMITQLALNRNEEAPKQIQFTVMFQTKSPDQLEVMLAALRNRDYRPYSARQSQVKGIVDYEATLLWQPDTSGREADAAAPEAPPVADAEGGPKT